MNKIQFPTTNFFKDKKYMPEKFSYEAMVLICINEYFSKFLLSQILGHSFNLKKDFHYFLNKFEINCLGKIKDENKEKYFDSKFHKIVYNFNLSNSRRKYRGIIEINTKFINKDSLEKSFYEIELNIFPEVDINVEFNTAVEEKILKLSEEFLNKIWSEIFKSLKQEEINNFKLDSCSKEDLTYLTSPILLNELISNQIITLFNDEDFIFDDSIVDLYHILFHLFINNQTESGSIFIKADDILECRNKKKNINSKGNRGGYKEKSKLKIHKNLRFLSELNLINIQELDKYFYSINFNKNMFSKENRIYPISRKIIEYNPKTQVWEKRIGEYLCFLLYIKPPDKCIVPVSKLISLTEDKTLSLRPSQIRDNFEKALDNLTLDNIIASWQYKNIDENKLSGKNWLEVYKRQKIVIEL